MQENWENQSAITFIELDKKQQITRCSALHP